MNDTSACGGEGSNGVSRCSLRHTWRRPRSVDGAVEARPEDLRSMPHGSNPELKPTDRPVHNKLGEKTMKMKRFLSICGVALLLGIGGISSDIGREREVKPSQESGRAFSVGPERVVNESIAGTPWTSGSSPVLRPPPPARGPTFGTSGPFNDTHFSVCVVGVNGGLAGKARCDISPQGGRSQLSTCAKARLRRGRLCVRSHLDGESTRPRAREL